MINFYYTNLFFYVHLVTYWILSLYFSFRDLLVNRTENKQQKYCDRNGTEYPINYKIYLYAFFVSIRSQSLILYPLLCFISQFYVFYNLDFYNSIKNIFYAIIIEEIYFYSFHRLLHTKWLWKYHSMHHELITPVAVATLYSSWFENLFCNFLPIIVMPLIVEMSLNLAIFWTFLATSSAVLSHCGFRQLKIMTEFHSFHHLYKNYNYGTIGLLDKIFCTYMK